MPVTDLSVRWRQSAIDHVDGCRFARTVVTHQTDTFAGTDGQTDPVERAHCTEVNARARKGNQRDIRLRPAGASCHFQFRLSLSWQLQ